MECHPAAVVVLTIGLWLIQPPCLSLLPMLTWLKCFIEKNRTSIDLSSIGDFGPFASIFCPNHDFNNTQQLNLPIKGEARSFLHNVNNWFSRFSSLVAFSFLQKKFVSQHYDEAKKVLRLNQLRTTVLDLIPELNMSCKNQPRGKKKPQAATFKVLKIEQFAIADGIYY